MSEEKILAVIESHPEAVVKALEKKPELLAGLILKLAPWDRFASKEDIKMLLEFMDKRFGDMNRRFEDVNKRFEDINKRFDDVNKRFDDANKRFEDMNRRFEDLRYYVDRRVGLVEKLLVGFNLPILTAVIILLIKAFAA